MSLKHRNLIKCFIIMAITFSFQVLSAQDTQLISKGAKWLFLDDGSNPEDNWITKVFDDKAWKSGLAQLGYGEDDEKTIVNFGEEIKNKFITTYFRKKFIVNDLAAVKALVLNILYDDGAVIYLNGHELTRKNMPTGIIKYTTLATKSISKGNEHKFHLYNVDMSSLISGENILAIEVHQSKAKSSDLSFDLELISKSTTVSVPESNKKSVPESNKKSVPESNKKSVPESNKKSAPESNQEESGEPQSEYETDF